MRQKYHAQECYNKRAEFLPVEWRSTLTLDGGKCIVTFYIWAGIVGF